MPPELPASSVGGSGKADSVDGDDDDAKQGDMFYPRLLSIAQLVKAQVVLLEVADLAQAVRVVRMVRGLGVFEGVEVWRDEPGAAKGDGAEEDGEEEGVRFLGRGNARSVVCWRGRGALWLGKGV